ncbi:MAG: hypothetical protein UH083_06155, partial [Ruminococcus sp.]|nr:hypothetical protein [Ruminococcus sp.]
MESVKPARERKTEQHSLRPAAMHAVYGGLGFLAANGAVMGNLAPFGAALTAAAPKRYLVAAMSGAAVGYLIRDPDNCFRYIAVVIAIGALRWLFSELDFIRQSRLFAPLLAFGTILSTG